MSDSIFTAGPGGFSPSRHAQGPWDPEALHGGAPAALVAAAFEEHPGDPRLRIARMGFEFLRPVPFAPLQLTTQVLRDGRRVQELAAEVSADGRTVCRASALRVAEVAAQVPAADPEISAIPGPDQARAVAFALDGADGGPSFGGSAMEMRFLEDPRELGPARIWMRMRLPLLPGRAPSPLARAAATADFGNGVSATLPFGRFLFINADLQLHMWRAPVGEWIGLDARTILPPGGTGLAESVLHDVGGAFGRAFQALVVEPR